MSACTNLSALFSRGNRSNFVGFLADLNIGLFMKTKCALFSELETDHSKEKVQQCHSNFAHYQPLLLGKLLATFGSAQNKELN